MIVITTLSVLARSAANRTSVSNLSNSSTAASSLFSCTISHRTAHMYSRMTLPKYSTFCGLLRRIVHVIRSNCKFSMYQSGHSEKNRGKQARGKIMFSTDVLGNLAKPLQHFHARNTLSRKEEGVNLRTAPKEFLTFRDQPVSTNFHF